MWYKVNFKKLVVLHLPTFWRSKKMVEWLQVLVYGMIDIQDDFLKNRKDHLYILNHNGQVCYLRKALNDAFDPKERRIKIVDGNQYKRKYVYTRGEQKPRYLNTLYLYERADYGDTGVDFIVLVPKNLNYNIYELKGLVDLYRIGSKRYKIEKY